MASTIRDVAQYSGLSLGTISKFINGGQVKEKTRLKIEEAIKKLKFKPNNIAKGLRNARTFTVGVLIPRLISSFASVIISALDECLLPEGYSVIVSECRDNAEMEIVKIKSLLHHMVDGIVLLPYSASGKQLEIIEESKIPFVVIDQLIQSHETDGIVLDNAAAIEEPVEALIQMGHRDLAIVTGSPTLYTSEGRLAGYQRALRRHNIPLRKEYIRDGNYTIEGGYGAALDLCSLKKAPTALIISNYEMTIGAVLALHYLRKAIPEDLSFIGFDSFPLEKVISPSLSLISQPMEEMGRSAARLLLKRLKGDYSGYPETIVHKATMRLTESVKASGKKQRLHFT